MIRVGFVNVFATREWLGGLNYLRNLLQAVMALEGRAIEPVLFTGTRETVATEFSFMPVVGTRLLDRGSAAWALRKASQRMLRADPMLERALAAQGISMLSHSGDLGKGARIPAIGWVPDLQHRHLPHLFSTKDFALRESQIARALDACTRMIVSSETAARELVADSPGHAGAIRVLRFVSGLLHGRGMPDAAAIRKKYAIEGRYLHLPNQFWAHKNHKVVIEALDRLKAANYPVTVIATGLMQDPRQPAHMDGLMAEVRSKGLSEYFRPLGVVPYQDMLCLMRESVAVINPSLFEGWSTSVEEAKSMGKAVVLSGIAVHREQAPARGIYFEPSDADDAARAIREAWIAFDPAADESQVLRAAGELPGRLRSFALGYQDIVLEAMQGSVHG